MKLFSYSLLFVFLNACSTNLEQVINETKNNIPVANLYADAETTPVVSLDDAADDPALWLNTKNPNNSLILGTDKRLGLMVYNLSGKLIQSLEVGRVNNVDVRQAVLIDSLPHDIAVASNRTDNTLTLFTISSEGKVSLVGHHPLSIEPYGSCMYVDSSGKIFVFVNSKSGLFQQWQIDRLSPLNLTLTREFNLASQPEGCATHDASGTLFMGEEEHGVWKLDLNKHDSTPQLLTSINDSVLVADVEGMDIYYGQASTFLVVSSQGDNSYATYDIGLSADNFEYKGSFRTIFSEETGIDGTQETDGIAIGSSAFGADYPKGLIVIQDGFNHAPKEAQNFKLLDWQKVQKALSLSR